MSENSCPAFSGPTAPSGVLISLKVLEVRCSHYSSLFFLAWEVHQSRCQASATDKHPSLHRLAPGTSEPPTPQKKLFCFWLDRLQLGAAQMQDSSLNSVSYAGPNHDLTMTRTAAHQLGFYLWSQMVFKSIIHLFMMCSLFIITLAISMQKNFVHRSGLRTAGRYNNSYTFKCFPIILNHPTKTAVNVYRWSYI